MEKRADREDEKDVFYIANGSYPQDATEKDKCDIRERAKQYRVQDGTRHEGRDRTREKIISGHGYQSWLSICLAL